MLYINKLTTDPQQQIILTGLPGISVQMTLRFMPRISRWVMGLTYQDFELEGLCVTTTPNMLRQYRNRIPFGIMCISASGLDPFTVNDFASQASNLYLLDSADVTTIEQDFFS